MKFCDKLQKIRKENNITQEGLADKLGVSRQAVSKWESGTAYPDTEKLIQISKLFNVSLDELINDNKEVNKQVENKKIKFNEIFEMVGNFISDTFNMFMAMKFKEKIKFLFEMAILMLFLLLAGVLVSEVITTLISKIFMFLPYRVLMGINDFVDALIYIGLIIIDVFIVIKVLKVRYLDYYIVIKDDSVDKVVTEEPIPELKDKKEYKLVIRDPKDSSFNIFKIIGKICLFGLKILGIIILFPIVIAFILLVMALVISLSAILMGIFFNGISLIILGSLVVTYLVIEFIFCVIFNRKIALKRIFLMFILGLFLVGVGLGLAVIGFASFDTEELTTVMDNKKTIDIKYDDKLIIPDIMDIDSNKIVIDNSLEDIKLEVLTDEFSNIVVTRRLTYNDNDENYILVYLNTDTDEYKMLKDAYNKFKDKKIVSFDEYAYTYEIDKVYISETNLTKIRENYDKVYE